MLYLSKNLYFPFSKYFFLWLNQIVRFCVPYTLVWIHYSWINIISGLIIPGSNLYYTLIVTNRLTIKEIKFFISFHLRNNTHNNNILIAAFLKTNTHKEAIVLSAWTVITFLKFDTISKIQIDKVKNFKWKRI